MRGIPHARENSKFEMRKLEIGECGPPTLLTRFAEELRRAPSEGGEGNFEGVKEEGWKD